MNLFREYLRWYQTAPTWVIYTAQAQQRQGLPPDYVAQYQFRTLPIPYTEPHPPTVSIGCGKAGDTRSPGDGQFPKIFIIK